jgi:hypothetical protein
MLTHPLYEKLAQLRLSGMLLGLKEQMNCPEVDRLSLCNVIMNGTKGKRNLRYRCWGSGVRFRGP